MRIISKIAAAAMFSACAGFGVAHAQDATRTMRIGVLADMSSLYAAIGGPGSVIAAQMAVDDYGGKVLGQTIEIVSADHQNKPDVASSIVRRWIDNENVVAIADNATSSAALAVQALIREQPKATVLTSGAGVVSLVEEACSPAGVLWTWNTRSVARTVASAALAEGKKKWFFITADYAFGHHLESEAQAVVLANGGEVVGSVRHPLNTSDFSSFLLQASASGADIIALANAGSDMTNSIKQAHEFGIGASGQSITALIAFVTDVHGIGLEASQNLLVAASFVWSHTPEGHAWSERFMEKHGSMPTDVQAGVYSSVLHYLKSMDAAGSPDPLDVVAKMRELPVNDGVFARNASVREDGLMLHELYLAQVKTPEESTGAWDYFKVVRTVSIEDAYWPLSESNCPLVNQ